MRQTWRGQKLFYKFLGNIEDSCRIFMRIGAGLLCSGLVWVRGRRKFLLSFVSLLAVYDCVCVYVLTSRNCHKVFW